MTHQEIDQDEAIKALLLEVARLQSENVILKENLVNAVGLAEQTHKHTQRLELANALIRYHAPQKKRGRPPKEKGQQVSVEIFEMAKEIFRLNNGEVARKQRQVLNVIVSEMELVDGKRWGHTKRKSKLHTYENQLAKAKKKSQ